MKSFIRYSFLVCFAGSLALPLSGIGILAYNSLSGNHLEINDDSGLFFMQFLVSLVGLGVFTAASITPYPQLARLGVVTITAIVAFIGICLLFP